MTSTREPRWQVSAQLADTVPVEGWVAFYCVRLDTNCISGCISAVGCTQSL